VRGFDRSQLTYLDNAHIYFDVKYFFVEKLFSVKSFFLKNNFLPFDSANNERRRKMARKFWRFGDGLVKVWWFEKKKLKLEKWSTKFKKRIHFSKLKNFFLV
jgi:hypothetical protein